MELQAQGVLGAIREDVRSPAATPATETRTQTSNCGGWEDDDDPFLLGMFCLALIDALFGQSQMDLEPIRLFNDSSDWRWFPAYPYPVGLSGYMRQPPVPIEHFTGQPGDVLDLKPWSVRLSLENGNNFDGLNRFTGTFLGETHVGLGLHTSWNYLHERLSCGYSDDLVLGNVTATWRFLDSRRFLARWGVGVWILTDHVGTDAGVNVHLSADYFPARPWVISALVEGGSLGSTGIVHTRVTAGWLWQRLEAFGGYDFMQIGSTNLHTPMVGARLWF